MHNALPLLIANDTFMLLADKAMYWPQHKTLLIADAHFGKAAAYRALGQPVPQGTTTANLQRLSALINAHPTNTIVFLGDFLHAPKSHAPATLKLLRQWREQHANIECILIRGNHDLSAGDPPEYLNIKAVAEPYIVGNIALQHSPKALTAHHVIAGHIHPTFTLQGKGRQSVRLPCFYHNDQLTLLPSFGDFTGGYELDTASAKGIFVTDGSHLWSVK
jgi:DNA ligase-associated metallophosphoesterase